MENPQKRLDRFKNNHPIESTDTLLNSLNNYFIPEIKLALKNKQYSLIVLGTHSIALTISESFWKLRGPDGYKKFLEEFINDNKNNFLEIADDIHNMRNNIAHQWLAKSNYFFGFNEIMDYGWKKENNIIYFNPKIYCKEYLKAFDRGGKIWQYNKTFLHRTK